MRTKRAFDLLVCFVAIPVVLPALLLAALAVRLTSGSPVLHRSTRIGRGERPFTILKLRTMVVAPAVGGSAVTRADDPRITPVGRVLRNLKLDELPQLWNVLVGDMSLVGPRPEDPRFVGSYSEQQRALFRLRPGLTSPATLAYRHEEDLLAGAGDDVEDLYLRDVLPAKLAIELEYLERRTLATDVRIFVATLGVVLRRRVPGAGPADDAAGADVGTGAPGLVAGVSLSAVAQAVPLVTTLGLTPFLLTTLGADAFGVWSLLVAFLLALTLLDGGVGASLARFLAMHRSRGDRAAAGRLLTGSLLVFLVAGVAVWILGAIAGPGLVGHLGIAPELERDALTVIHGLGPVLFLALASAAARSLLQASERFGALASLTAGAYGGFAVATVLILDTARSPLLTLLVLTGARYAVIVVGGLLLARGSLELRRPFLPPASDRRAFLAYASRMQISGFTSIVNNQADALIVGALLPVRYVGYYAIGNQAATAVRSLPLYAFPPILVRITTAFEQGGLQAAQRAFASFQARWLPLVVGYGAVVGVTIPFAVEAWVHGTDRAALIVATVLTAGFVVQVAITGMRTCLVRAVGRPGLETRYSVVGMGLNLALTLPFGIAFGLTGVVVATATGLVAGSLYYQRLCAAEAGAIDPPLSDRWIPAVIRASLVTFVLQCGVYELGLDGPAGLLAVGAAIVPGLVLTWTQIWRDQTSPGVVLTPQPLPDLRGLGG